ncbi:glycerophosphoryl diester phosphodiesterase membrane domain-containing protein [Pseudokineococcus sp. 1T1Z-3]|uniref:glycerophosphoryl diester phosphodiesterase membrane domain-containing protein n=1 Tax=Pseudokineococcus sp. 1T1Z-3 TaxID=3132745 RepID=UPI00309ECE73
MSADQGWAAPGGRGADGRDGHHDDEGGADPAPAPAWALGSQPAAGAAESSSVKAGTPQGWGPPPGTDQTWSAPLRPGVVPLRPLGVFEIFEGGFRSISANPKVMLGISAAVFGGVAVLSLLLAPLFGGVLASVFNDLLAGPGVAGAGGTQELDAFDFAGADPVTFLVSVVATIALTGLLVLSVSGSVIGREVSASTLWQRVRGRLLALVGLSLLQTLVYLVAFVTPPVAGALLFFSSTSAGVVGLLLGLLAGTALLAWVATGWAFGPVALLLEQRSVLGALGRSWGLVRGTWWRVFGVLLLTLVVTTIATLVLVGPASVVAAVIDAVGGGGAGASAAAVFIGLLFQTLAQILVFPFSAAVTALLYTDLRIRQEGLDVELARAAEASP